MRVIQKINNNFYFELPVDPYLNLSDNQPSISFIQLLEIKFSRKKKKKKNCQLDAEIETKIQNVIQNDIFRIKVIIIVSTFQTVIFKANGQAYTKDICERPILNRLASA